MKIVCKRIVVCFVVIAMMLSCISSYYISAEALSIGTLGRISNGMPTDNYVYNIRSASDSRYLDVLSGGVESGTNVRTFTYNGYACQEWRIEFIDGTDDECMIMDINSGKYLSIYGSSSASGANAWIWHFDGTSGQRFKIVNVSGGIYRFLTEASGYQKALGVDVTTHNVQQMEITGTATNFYLEQASYSKGMHDGKTLLQNIKSNMFIYNEMNWLTADYAIQRSINDYVTFCNVRYLGDGYYTIYFEDENVCLTVDESVPSNADIVKLKEYDENHNGQKWKMILADGMCQFQPKSGLNSSLFLCSQNDINDSKLIISNLSGIDSEYSLWSHAAVNSDFKTIGMYASLFADDSHDLSHYKWLNGAVSPLFKKNSTLYSRMELDIVEEVGIHESQMLENIEKSSISVVWTHGDVDDIDNEIYLTLNPISNSGSSIGNQMRLYVSSYKDYLIEYTPEEGEGASSDTGIYDFSSVSCIIFAVCHSAHNSYTSPNSLNFLSASVYGGVSYAIGFDASANCQYILSFLDDFYAQYQTSGSIISAFQAGVANNPNSDDNKPCLLTSSYQVYYDESEDDKVGIIYY